MQNWVHLYVGVFIQIYSIWRSCPSFHKKIKRKCVFSDSRIFVSITPSKSSTQRVWVFRCWLHPYLQGTTNLCSVWLTKIQTIWIVSDPGNNNNLHHHPHSIYIFVNLITNSTVPYYQSGFLCASTCQSATDECQLMKNARKMLCFSFCYRGLIVLFCCVYKWNFPLNSLQYIFYVFLKFLSNFAAFY